MARRLVLVLGDQLDSESAAFDDFDAERDVVAMAEVDREATHVRCHKKRIAFFFAAMRGFRDALRERGVRVEYHEIGDEEGSSFAGVFGAVVRAESPEKIVVAEPGDWRVREELRRFADEAGIELEIRTDRHFYSTVEEFNEWADGRKRIVLEDFYRELRKRRGILVDEDGRPEGGEWNYDKENRETFGRQGPPDVAPPPSFAPDGTTQKVIAAVEPRYGDHPGALEDFDLPTNREQALRCLDDFIAGRLPRFGAYQDALWGGERVLFHSRLSALLNVKLLRPRECVERAVQAYRSGTAPLNSVEGFVRQILGWREFVRGVYWRWMPEYAERNALECADWDPPPAYWDGRTAMRCVADAMRNVLDNAYAHHIQRLMILGLFAQLLGVHPRKFHDWHMAMYLDAIDWVSLPNTLGMSQYGDGGIVGTKPYCASGAYIQRMSNHCSACRYNPKKATGEDACPMTTLYWDFLDRGREQFSRNRRMVFQIKNLERKGEAEMRGIREQAVRTKQRAFAGEL